MNLEPIFSSASVEWETPQSVFDALDAEFHFTLDPCSTDENAKCKKHYTKAQDGLSQDWTGETVYCNPPYGKEMPAWIEKCAKHKNNGGTAVMLIPARTDTKAFHDWIYNKAEIRFIPGRLKFGGSKHSAPFPSMVVVFRPHGKGATYHVSAENVTWEQYRKILEICPLAEAEKERDTGGPD